MSGTIPIGARIETRLGELGQTAAWLAEMVGVPRSTITRILKGERNPTPETLHEIAPVLGVEVAQLVAGTDAAERVKEAKDIVSRRDYEGAVHQVIEYERKANDLAAQVRSITERHEQDQRRIAEYRTKLETSERGRVLAEDQRDRARGDAQRFEHDAQRYREGLEKAVADVAELQTKVRELGALVESSRMTSRAGAILAGVAAAVSVASYLGDDPEPTVPKKKSAREKPQAKRGPRSRRSP